MSNELLFPGHGVTVFGNTRDETKRNLRYALGFAKLKTGCNYMKTYLIIDANGLYLKAVALHGEVRNVEFTPDPREALRFSENAAFGVETLLTYAFHSPCRAEALPLVAFVSSLTGAFVKSLEGGIETTPHLHEAKEFTQVEATELLKNMPQLRLGYVTYKLQGRRRLPTEVYIK